MFHTWKGISFYNDSAATIPHATTEAVRSLAGPVILIAGGTDKNIDFSPLEEVARTPRAILLLAGSGTEKIRALLAAQDVPYEGPFSDLAEAVRTAIARAMEATAQLHEVPRKGGIPAAGTNGVAVLFSPGCTSFGMFRDEFDRGRRFKETVRALTGPGSA